MTHPKADNTWTGTLPDRQHFPPFFKAFKSQLVNVPSPPPMMFTPPQRWIIFIFIPHFIVYTNFIPHTLGGGDQPDDFFQLGGWIPLPGVVKKVLVGAWFGLRAAGGGEDGIIKINAPHPCRQTLHICLKCLGKLSGIWRGEDSHCFSACFLKQPLPYEIRSVYRAASPRPWLLPKYVRRFLYHLQNFTGRDKH